MKSEMNSADRITHKWMPLGPPFKSLLLKNGGLAVRKGWAFRRHTLKAVIFNQYRADRPRNKITQKQPSAK